MTQAEHLAAQAAQWQAAGRIDMAAQLYGAALQHDPSQFVTRMQLADCLAYLGQAEPAAEQYRMVAQAYAARGYPSECLAVCERILAIAPHTFVYVSMGPMIRRIGRQARAVCTRAADLHLASGRLTDGLQLLRLGAELDPQNPTIRVQLAQIYQSRGMVREAVDALSDAGDLLLQAKRCPEFIGVAEHLLTLAPDHLATLRDLARAHLELARPQVAVQVLGRLTAVSPGDVVGYELLAQAFASLGHLDRARSVLERLVERLGATGRPDQADAILNHARYWRPQDLEFTRTIERMRVPRPPAPAPIDRGQAPVPEDTVTLTIADLLIEEGTSVSAAPSREPAVELTEAEGTVTLRLADLILDEASPGQTEPRGPSAPVSSVASEPSEVDSTISLDGRALMEMLVYTDSTVSSLEGLRAPDEPRGSPPAVADASARPSVVSTPSAAAAPSLRAAQADDVNVTRPFPAAASPRPAAPPSAAPPSAASTEPEDEAGDDAEPDTLLHMKPLTALDIARTRPQSPTPPKPPARRAASAEARTPTPSAHPSPPTEGTATIARMQPLTAADIAEVMSGSANARAADTGTDTSATLPFVSSPAAPARPRHAADDDDDDTVMNPSGQTPRAPTPDPGDPVEP